MGQHIPQLRDLVALAAAAERHAEAWEARSTVTPEAEAEAYQHLAQAVGALERLAVAADALRGPLAAALVAHQTDQADALTGVWDQAEVTDRKHGFDPDGLGRDGGRS